MTRQNAPDRLPRVPGRPPSDRSVGRLRAELTTELVDLQDAVDDELRLVQVLRDAGEVDAARLLLDRPSRRLEASQQRLRDLVARAAVERAAEGVLAGVRDRTEPRRRQRARRLQRAPMLLAGAVAVALAMVASPPDVRASAPPPVATLGAGTVATSMADPASGPGQVTALPPAAYAAGPHVPQLATGELFGAAPAGNDLAAGPAPRPATSILGLLDHAALALRRTARGSVSTSPPIVTTTTTSLAEVSDRGSDDASGREPSGRQERGDGTADRVTDEATRSVPATDGDAAEPLGDLRDAVGGHVPSDPVDADVVPGVDGR